MIEPVAVEAESLLWSHLEPAEHAVESCYGVMLWHHAMEYMLWSQVAPALHAHQAYVWTGRSLQLLFSRCCASVLVNIAHVAYTYCQHTQVNSA